MRYRGVNISKIEGGYAWEEPIYGQESEDVFASVDDAKADIERWFGDGPALMVVDGEIVHPGEFAS